MSFVDRSFSNFIKAVMRAGEFLNEQALASALGMEGHAGVRRWIKQFVGKGFPAKMSGPLENLANMLGVDKYEIEDLYEAWRNGKDDVIRRAAIAAYLAKPRPVKPILTPLDDVVKIVRWFEQQDDVLRTAVLGGVDEGMEAAYAHALRKLADEYAAERQEGMGQ